MTFDVAISLRVHKYVRFPSCLAIVAGGRLAQLTIVYSLDMLPLTKLQFSLPFIVFYIFTLLKQNFVRKSGGLSKISNVIKSLGYFEKESTITIKYLFLIGSAESIRMRCHKFPRDTKGIKALLFGLSCNFWQDRICL